MDFGSDVRQNTNNSAILSRWRLLDLPGSWLVAGCLFQTVWNIQARRPPVADIKDYDIFYFDSSDLSEGAEAYVQSPGLAADIIESTYMEASLGEQPHAANQDT